MRSKTEQAMFKGLSKRITSKHFVTNLALMYDVLCEISIISEELQKRDLTIVQKINGFAAHFIFRKFKISSKRKETAGSSKWY